MKSHPDGGNASGSERVSSETRDATGSTNEASDSGAKSSGAELTKEEQWALFEKELKENDWGHQPC